MNAIEEPSDRELLRDVRRGKPEAVEALTRRHWERAQQVAYGILGDARWADDVTQEAINSIVGDVGLLDSYRPFAPRLRRVVSRRARGWARVRARRSSDHFQTQMEVSHA